MKLSAALSYYTVFSLGPVSVIVISLAGIFWGREAVQGKVYGQISTIVGHTAAVQVQEIIKNIEVSRLDTSGAVIGMVFLLIAATTVFAEMQDSLNFILSVRAKPRRGFLRLIINRLISFSLLISIGFLLAVSLILNALVELLHDRLTMIFTNTPVILFDISNWALILLVITCLFTIIYKVLPDAHIYWRDAMVGAVFTSVLFTGGKWLISLYVSHSNLDVTYGTATSIIILLLWVYYSAVILYFGAEFTKVFAINYGSGITPDKTAVFVVKKESKEVPSSHRIELKRET